jgi:hypothetical protein
MKKVLFFVVLFLVTTPTVAEASNKPPVLVIDKCPEFCPPGIKGPILVVDKCPAFCPPGIKGPTKPIQMCTQALIPVPNRPGYWYTDGCKKTIIKEPSKIKENKK